MAVLDNIAVGEGGATGGVCWLQMMAAVEEVALAAEVTPPSGDDAGEPRGMWWWRCR